jgi:Fic family protein
MAPAYAHQPPPTLQDLAWLIDAEYQEMPGMRLTFAQVRRLWNLSADECTRVLDYLVDSGVLTQDEDHRFCRGVEAY